MKPILFIDFDGTLCHDRFWRSADKAIQEKIQDFLFSSKNTLASEWMKGSHTSEEINRILSRELNVDFDTLWQIFVHDCETMKVSHVDLNLVAVLKDRYYTVLATDNMDCLDRFTVPALRLGNYFDLILNSYNERMFKNDLDGKFYMSAAKNRGVDVKGCVLVDNSAKTCELFGKIGGAAFLVTESKPLQYWLGQISSKNHNPAATFSSL